MNSKIDFNLNDYDFLISKSLEIILGLVFLIFGICTEIIFSKTSLSGKAMW